MLADVRVIASSAVRRLNTKQTIVGESPRWLDRHGKLIFLDILGKQLRLYDPLKDQEQIWDLPEVTGCCLETVHPDIVMLGAETGLFWFDLKTAEITPWLPVETETPTNRLNDGRCDPQGVLWIGTMNMTIEPRPPVGALYRIDQTGQIGTIETELCIPNTLCFSPSGDAMYFADSLERLVWRYERNPQTGALGRKSVFFAFDDKDKGIPDGASVDTEGGVWIAIPEGGRVERRLPNGQLDLIIKTPAGFPTMCSFGGENRNQLYITTLSKHLDDAGRKDQPNEGALYVVDTEFQGLFETPFDPQ